MFLNALSILGIIFAFLFLLTGIRALLFARRHKDKLALLGIVGKSAWWLRLFKTGGFGPEAEAERRRLSVALLVFGGLFFATGGLIQLLAPPI